MGRFRGRVVAAVFVPVRALLRGLVMNVSMTVLYQRDEVRARPVVGSNHMPAKRTVLSYVEAE